MDAMMETTITECKALIQAFLDGEMPAEVFAEKYDKAFRFEWHEMDKALFDILQNLWEDAEAYSPLWLPEDIGPFNITEETLRQEAAQTLAELNQRYS